MDLKVKNDIEDNIFSTTITIDAFGTEALSEDEEKELLKDFPTKLVYRTLSFEKRVKKEGNILVTTPDVLDANTVVNVKLPALSNREIPIDENFEATYKIDVDKISPSTLDDHVLTTKELVAQAYCVVFADVVCAEIKKIMDGLREKAPNFTSEKIVEI